TDRAEPDRNPPRGGGAVRLGERPLAHLDRRGRNDRPSERSRLRGRVLPRHDGAGLRLRRDAGGIPAPQGALSRCRSRLGRARSREPLSAPTGGGAAAPCSPAPAPRPRRRLLPARNLPPRAGLARARRGRLRAGDGTPPGELDVPAPGLAARGGGKVGWARILGGGEG